MNKPTSPVSRRAAIRMIAAVPLGASAACGSPSAQGAADAGVDVATGDVLTDAALDVAADAAVDTAADAALDVATSGWATGGTASMSGQDAYPDPFTAGRFTTCDVTCAATVGPCHTASPERRDISDGWDGLPVRLALQVVDENCDPVPDVIVEVWHTNYRGGYSGDMHPMCVERDEDRAAGFFRGYQRTDAEGKVAFDTCYPGWYPGRAVHIHFRVLADPYDPDDGAAAEIVSQFFFADALNDEIFANEALYTDFGAPDRTLVTDGISGRESDMDRYLLEPQRLADGAMLASARIVLRDGGAGCWIGG